jgi:hypothetical protein
LVRMEEVRATSFAIVVTPLEDHHPSKPGQRGCWTEGD